MAVFAWCVRQARRLLSAVGMIASDVVSDDLLRGAAPKVSSPGEQVPLTPGPVSVTEPRIEHHVHVVISDAQIRKAVRAELKPMVESAVKALRKGSQWSARGGAR